jgi:acyl carrier protein
VTVKSEIRQFIVGVIAADAGQGITDFDDDESLLDAGVLDSLGVLKLVSFLDEEMHIDLPLEKLSLEDFASVDSICALIERYRAP